MEGKSMLLFLFLSVGSIHLARSDCTDSCMSSCASHAMSCRFFAPEVFCDQRKELCDNQCEIKCRCEEICVAKCDQTKEACLDVPDALAGPLKEIQCNMNHQTCSYNCGFIVFCNDVNQDFATDPDSDSGFDSESDSDSATDSD